MTKKIVILSFFLLAVLTFPLIFVQAQDQGGEGFKNPLQCETIAVCLKAVLNNIILPPLGIIAIIAIVWGGVQYIIAAGEESKIEKAKKTITYAIIGLIFVGLAAVIVNFIVTRISG